MKQSLKIVGLAIGAMVVAAPAFATAVPEMDPSMAVSGLITLIGGVLVLVERRRRRK